MLHLLCLQRVYDMNKNLTVKTSLQVDADQAKKKYMFAALLAYASLLLMFFRFGGEKSIYIYMVGVLSSMYVAYASIMFSRIQQRKRKREGVFIIYHRSDVEDAHRISKALAGLGFRPWLDVEQIRPGMRWLAAIEAALNECSSALLLVSKNLDIDDETIAKEISIAMSNMRTRDDMYSPVIPVVLDDSPIPDILKDVTAAKLDGNDDIERLAQGLQRVLRGGS